MSRTKKIVLVLTPAVVAVLAAGLWAFQPWKAFTRSTVQEALPVAVATSTSTTGSTTPAVPRELAAGAFVSQEHDTGGRARVLDLGDGNRVLRLEGFSTSDGPDVHVWLSEATAGGEWGKYDDGAVVKLGKIKATDGDQNYAIPADADLDGLRSVVIWCDRFNVAFGSAPLNS